MAKAPKSKKVESLTHDKARRINVPTAELQSLADQQEELAPRPPKHYPRARPLPKGETRDRDPDLDPQIVWNGVKINLTKEQAAQLAETGTVEIGDAQLVWRGKDRQDWSDLVVNVPMLYVQEKVHPKAIIDDLKRQTKAVREAASDAPDLFADFNGLTDPEARAEFYQHAMHWQNRMILGDSLQVMASLAEREALRGKVQCIYFDPPAREATHPPYLLLTAGVPAAACASKVLEESARNVQADGSQQSRLCDLSAFRPGPPLCPNNGRRSDSDLGIASDSAPRPRG